MSKFPIVSIITPSLNQGQFIEETIQSVLFQEGDFYLDYIIVDGGSTDNTLEIIKKYEQLLKEGKYPVKCRGIEYRWISEPDEGQADAINKGFKLVKGDILAWLNADDIYAKNSLKIIAQEFTLYPIVYVIFGNIEVTDEKGERKYEQKGVYNGFDKLIESWNHSGYSIHQPAIFFKKECILKVGLLDERLKFLFDYDLWIRFARIYQFHYVNKILAKFRVYSKSKTGYMGADYIWERVSVSKRYWKYLSQEDKDKMKVDSIRFLIKKLLVRTEQACKKHDLFQVAKCVFYFSKAIIEVFTDKLLISKTVHSLKKYILHSPSL